MMKKLSIGEASIVYSTEGLTELDETPSSHDLLAHEILSSLADTQRVKRDPNFLYEGGLGDDERTEPLTGFSFWSRP